MESDISKYFEVTCNGVGMGGKKVCNRLENGVQEMLSFNEKWCLEGRELQSRTLSEDNWIFLL